MNRKQYTQINDFNSDFKDIDVGLTQGDFNSHDYSIFL